MLQRIQSIWLLLAAACAFLSFQFPFYTGVNKELIPSSILDGKTTIPLILVTAAVGIISLICIFLYKNRKLQLRLTVLCIALEALLIFLYYTQVKTFTDGTYALTALLQGCIVFFLFLAARGINHDEKIIRDSNRLR
jgi:peptidoglycan/LPS O-acetylase OafA/YrhL